MEKYSRVYILSSESSLQSFTCYVCFWIEHHRWHPRAIYRARQIQKDAAAFGFDWPDISPVFDKLEEELAELKHAFSTGDSQAISDEIGDLMFVCINLARHARVNAEMSLRNTNQKFLRRFAYVQQQMSDAGIEMDQQQLEQMEHFWQESKSTVG